MRTLKLFLTLEAIDKATATVRRISKAVGALAAPAARVGQAWANLSSLMRSVVTAVGLAGGAAAGAFFGFKRVADEVDRIADQARQLGITTQRLQELGFAAQMNGSSADVMAQALERVSQQIVEARGGAKEAVELFERLGITQRELKTIKADQVMERMAETFHRVGETGQNAEKKIDTILKLAGRTATSLIPLFNQGPAAIKRYADEARRLGIVLDTKTVDAMGEFNDQVDRARLTAFGALANALRAITPKVTKVVERFTSWTVANREWIATKVAEYFERIERALPKILAAGAGLLATVELLATAAGRVSEVFGGWENLFLGLVGLVGLKMVVAVGSLTAAVGSLTAAAATNPFTWVAGALAVLTAIVFKLEAAVALAEKLASTFQTARFMPIIGPTLNYLSPPKPGEFDSGPAIDPNERRGSGRRGGTPRELSVGGLIRVELDEGLKVRLLKKDSLSIADIEVERRGFQYQRW